MASNPFVDNEQKSRRHSDDFALDLARVKRVEDDDDHQAVVEIVSTDTEAPAKLPATVSHTGDVALPSEGDMVVVGYARGQKPVVIGTVYTRQDNPQYGADERHVHGDGGVFLVGPFAAAPKVDSDPASPPDGAVWYRTDLNEYRGVENGTTVSFDTTAV